MIRRFRVVPWTLLSLLALSLLPAAGLAQTARLAAEREAAELQPRVLYVASDTEYLHSALLEEKLQQRPEFRRLGLVLTRDRARADLVLEVHRSIFTTSFTFTLLDPHASQVVASGKVNSLFGTASGKIAKQVVTILGNSRLGG